MAYTTFSTARSASAFGWATDTVARTANAVVAWNSARRTRNALLALSAHELEDIGLNRAVIDAIAAKGRL